MISCRSRASDTAWRTRTSLHGFWSVRIERSFTTFDVNSAVRSDGRVWRSRSLIATQSVRLIVPGNSQPRS